MVKYKPMLVNDICKLPSIGASILKKFLISNWSRGLVIIVYDKLDTRNKSMGFLLIYFNIKKKGFLFDVWLTLCVTVNVFYGNFIMVLRWEIGLNVN